jgi:hypothetical protein
MLKPVKGGSFFVRQNERARADSAKRLKLKQRLFHFHFATKKRHTNSVLVQHLLIAVYETVDR